MSAVTVLDAHLAYFGTLTRRSGGEVVEADGAQVFVNPHPLPFLLNAVARVDPAADPGAVLDAAAAAFAARDRDGYEVIGLEGRDDDLVAAAAARGMATSGPDPLQLLAGPLAPPVSAPPAGVDVRWASSAADVGDVVTVTQIAHRVYGFPDDVWPTIFGRPETVLSPDMGVAVATLDGHPVGTAQCHLQGRVAYIGWVAVVPEAGRRGIGDLVTRHAVEWGYERGADTAALMASPMGAPVYRRMGFLDVGGLISATAAPG